MTDNWENYRDWKKLQENMRNKFQEDNDYEIDDEVEDLKELFKEYID